MKSQTVNAGRIPLNDKRIVVTGGAGFIGSNIARALCEENDVTVIDNMSTGRRANLCGLEERIRLVECDINDIKMLKEEFESVDYVLHQAALPSVQRSIMDPMTTNRSNVDGTLAVLVAARDCGVNRVVFASSSAVYGDSPELPKRESSVPRPMSPYAVTKLVGEHYCRVFHEIYGLECVSLRYFNVFGPGQDPASEYAAVIPKFIDAVLSGSQPVVYGDGEQTRDFVYVKDVVRANILACISPRASGLAINIGTGYATSLNRLLDAIRKILKREIRPIYTEPRPGDVRNSVADITLAREVLGYVPEYRLEDGLREMLERLPE
ncbi:MAG: SDR family oxidoreductase [Methanothrix sp.]|uniref:SDR family oxidoreductase n=1 Tax=Methanothrix sp. TaxID=90426 RepID=UPI0032AF11EB|nr:SDR family oxidoreductase [Methanothrix sp.]